MSAAFKVGDICIFQNAKFSPQRNGEEVTIVAFLAKAINGRTGEDMCNVYLLDKPTLAGENWLASPHQLRKKHPPRSAKSIMREVIAKAKEPVREPA